MTMMYDKNYTLTENGALSYATTGRELIDQFSHVGTAIGRPIKQVWQEQKKLWDENPEMALRFPFYLRLVTRKVKVKISDLSFRAKANNHSIHLPHDREEIRPIIIL